MFYTAEVLDLKIEVTFKPSEEEITAPYMEDMWIEENKKRVLNEEAFVHAFRDVNLLKFNNGTFYSRNGSVSYELLKHDIWESLVRSGLKTDTDRQTAKLFNACMYACSGSPLKTDENIIPFANGNLYVNEWKFIEDEFTTVPYRLSASLEGFIPDTPYFEKWLSDLFEPEDRKTIQEYLGYCLVPTTKCQKALFLLGEGGAGKSGLGVILEAILGNAVVNVSNTQEFLQDKFKLPELENRLVLYDDDLDSSALTGTGFYKKLITNTLAITADKKYGQPYKFTPKIKLIACCNQMLSSVYDTSSGFYRRLLPVLVKPIRKDFVPDLRFYDHLREEANGIVIWALQGLKRLIENDWVLTESTRTKSYMAVKQSLENPLTEFMNTMFVFDPDAPGVTTTEIMRVYREWCLENSYTAQKPRTVQMWLADNAERLGIKASTHVPSGDKRVRGYKGMRLARPRSGKIRLM